MMRQMDTMMSSMMRDPFADPFGGSMMGSPMMGIGPPQMRHQPLSLMGGGNMNAMNMMANPMAMMNSMMSNMVSLAPCYVHFECLVALKRATLHFSAIFHCSQTTNAKMKNNEACVFRGWN